MRVCPSERPIAPFGHVHKQVFATMSKTHAVGIDLGTTYSCISYLNEHGEPVTLANAEGEMSTPSAVLIDGTEVVVGTEALRHAVIRPGDVILNAKRYIGEEDKVWNIGGKKFTPIDAEALVLKKLIGDAQSQIGPIEQAVITVPAQFSDGQRHATIEAGVRAGLQSVNIINEPVAASLCHVLGAGMWFSELADDQIILVYDLGGGTFDLSLVKYKKDEVSVIASSGDLLLGGNDWTDALMNAIADQFVREFGSDPRKDPSSKQALLLETEQAKRSLSTRPKTALTVQHAGHRKSYQVEQTQFEMIARPLIERTMEITKRLLADNKMGWAKINAVLSTGGSSRMPMVRESLKELSGRTLNTSLSPDQSISHGATYYAGMLLSNSQFATSILSDKARERLSRVKQQSVTARSLGILVRDMKTHSRVPHYLIPANSSLPVEIKHQFGTVVPNQKRVHLQVVESGTSPTAPHTRIGQCVIDGLPPKLPEGSIIEVTILYDREAKVQVSARDVASGKQVTTEIIRSQAVVNQLEMNTAPEEDVVELDLAPEDEPILAIDDDDEKVTSASPTIVTQRPASPPLPPPVPTSRETPAIPPPVKKAAPSPVSPKPQPVPVPKPQVKPTPAAGSSRTSKKLDEADRPVPLCNRCGEPLSMKGDCAKCGPVASVPTPKKSPTPASGSKSKPPAPPRPVPKPMPSPPSQKRPVPGGSSSAAAPPKPPAPPPPKPAATTSPKPMPLPKPVPPPPTPVAGPKPTKQPLLDDDDILELDDASTRKKPNPSKPKSGGANRGKPGENSDDFWSLT